jgi:hypothetical protein
MVTPLFLTVLIALVVTGLTLVYLGTRPINPE